VTDEGLTLAETTLDFNLRNLIDHFKKS